MDVKSFRSFHLLYNGSKSIINGFKFGVRIAFSFALVNCAQPMHMIPIGYYSNIKPIKFLCHHKNLPLFLTFGNLLCLAVSSRITFRQNQSIACTPTLINEMTGDGNISVFPNPSSDILNIRLRSGNVERVNIYDAMNKIIFTQSQTSSNTVNIADLKSGIYFVRVNESNWFRFLKE